MYPTRILLADDHALVRAGIRNALEGEASLQIVGEVGDGPGLIQALEDLRRDLLLIDVTMPNFEPVATIHRIRLRYPNMFILVVSAYDDDVYVQGLLRAGVNGYHLKDQPLSDLRLAVERVLTGKRWISSSLVDKLIQPTEAIQPDTPKLSSRQIDILHLLSKGLDNRAIAAKLGLSVKTIETHLTRLYRQLNVQSRLEAANFAHEHPELITRAAKNAAPDNQLLLPQEQQASILIVDDNQRYRQQLRRMVGRIYPQAMIYEAANTQDALHLVQRLSPQLVFVDVVLGDERHSLHTTDKNAIAPFACDFDERLSRPGISPTGVRGGAKALLDKKDLDAATLFQIITDAIE